MELKGTVKDILFQSDDSGYVVAKFKIDEGLVTIVGIIPYIFIGQILRITGEVVKHPTFGEQIKVTSADEVLPETQTGIEKYLSSGIISGIGPATAKKITKEFGNETFDIMDNDIDRLLTIEGIGVKKLAVIKESYLKSREVRNIMVFLQSYGVTTKQCMKIYYRYGQNSIAVVKENPYILSDDIPTFGFKTADRIAENLGIDKRSPFRIECGIKYELNRNSGFGHTCIPLINLTETSMSLLEVEEDLVKDGIRSLILKDAMVLEEMDDEQFIFTPSFYHCELSITKKIFALSNGPYKNLGIDLDKSIETYEKRHHIKLHEKQKEAVKVIENTGFGVITGGPGTGKTTIIKCILALFKEAGLKVLMAAPTGRAAKRMTEATGEISKTIHRLLDLGVSVDGEEFGSDETLDCDCVIIDEASMLDVILMNNLMNSIKPGTRLILVGDVDQLPSVGPGKVLYDIIDSNAAKTVKLEMIYRQGKKSMITLNAHKINNGEKPILNSKDSDFFYISADDHEVALDTLVSLVETRLPSFNKSWDPLKDMQILTPMRKGDLGIYSLNEKMRDILNKGEKESYKFTEFKVGDKVMQTKNNYNLKSRLTPDMDDNTVLEDTGVFNGDIGYVHSIDGESEIVTVFFDDERYVDYTEQDLDDLELAYAVTIHKSQGSEFKVVVMPLYMGPPLLMNRNLLYTAVTRAKELVVLIGEYRALNYMIWNNRSFERYSSLGYRLKKTVAAINELKDQGMV
ncbi:MAG: ATP-dependent RecD-like DNA helicase [Clostridiaceae bacterium]